jgi:hypothetical protein
VNVKLQGCGARIVTEGQGELTSPNYPHQWETGGNCSWIIVGAQASKCQNCSKRRTYVF